MSGRDVWRDAADWIEGNGGYVHPELRYDPALRQVYLGGTGDDDGVDTAAEGGSLERNDVIDADTILLQIPDACLVTLHSAEDDTAFGKSLFGVVHSLHFANKNTPNNYDRVGLYNDPQDVILALFLAHLRYQLNYCSGDQTPNDNVGGGKESSSRKGAAEASPWLFYRPYLATLPSNPSTENATNNDDFGCHLPRRWSAITLQRRLCGTSLFARVLKERDGLRNEYELVRNAWLEKRDNNKANIGNISGNSNKTSHPDDETSFPPLEYYDAAMATLTSRSFSELGNDGVDAFIPMLDLLNHVRVGNDAGGSSNREGESGNENSAKFGGGPCVRYKRYLKDQVKMDGHPFKRQKMVNDNNGVTGGGVRVSASRSLPIGSELHMTYGAKGNAALLGRYGFCIPNNDEPDGSCNDVLQLKIKSNQPPVKLQRGPKSYSYCPFVKALELCRNKIRVVVNEMGSDCVATRDDIGSHVSHENDEDEGDQMTDGGLEAFLDSCDNEFKAGGNADNDDDDDDDRSFYNASVILNASKVRNSHRASMVNDLHAIKTLKGILQNARAERAKNPLAGLSLDARIKGEDGDIAEEDRYCAMLVRSEIQTIDFYLASADALRRGLEEHLDHAHSKTIPLLESQQKDLASVTAEEYLFDNEELVQEQIDALVGAFLSIRYPLIAEKA